MNIGIVDADLVGHKKHRFPNLASMKISAYYKERGDNVELITRYYKRNGARNDVFNTYDKIFISKVFTSTLVPEWVLKFDNVECGGTGFFYDKAPKLPDEIEHHMPDYHLYDDYVDYQINTLGKNKNNFRYYIDYSIGFLTRGCFRKCPYCVNQNYDRCVVHSPLEEFLDPDRRKICLLDDNFFACPQWKELLESLQASNRPFQFKQGLDERLLTDEKCRMMAECRCDGEYIFAFDNIAESDLIEEKMKLIKKYIKRLPKFYVLCGFDRNGKYDDEFWKKDLWDLFRRIEILEKYQCLPYITRFNKYEESPYRGMYITIARWCNQPRMFKNFSIREYVDNDIPKNADKDFVYSSLRYLRQIEKEIPELAERYFDMKWHN